MVGMQCKAPLVACLCVVTVTDVAAAVADEGDSATRARALSNQGLADFKSGHYVEAIDAFLASYALVPVPALIFDIAQASRLRGDCDKALQYYERYLHEAPDARNRVIVEAHIGEMRACARTGSSAPAAHEEPATRPALGPAVATATVAAVVAPRVSATTPVARSRPIYKRWWVWSCVGAAVVAGVVVGAVVGTRPPTFHTNLPVNGPGALVQVPF
jgi:hypothetical protein